MDSGYPCLMLIPFFNKPMVQLAKLSTNILITYDSSGLRRRSYTEIDPSPKPAIIIFPFTWSLVILVTHPSD